jgi:hypothetical protein
MKKMKLKNQILIGNAAILAGLAIKYFYFRRSSLLSVVVTGILLLAMVNLIFFVRSREKGIGL